MQNNKTTRVLVCDDRLVKQESFVDTLKDTLLAADKNGFDIQVCDWISDEGVVARGQSLPLGEVGSFDILLLDVYWEGGDGGKGEPKGIELCRKIRARFPELPIIILSEHAEVGDLETLIGYRIDGFVSHRDPDLAAVAATLLSIREKIKYDYKGKKLLSLLRKLQSSGRSCWQPELVSDAANAFWAPDSSRGKWDGFWSAWSTYLGTQKLNGFFDRARTVFSDTELMNLGAVPHMRGHLEHVVYVYFTGYVISHQLDGFRPRVMATIRLLLGDRYDPSREAVYWDAFNLAWLSCATLHDTGYCLELLPEVLQRLREVQKAFPFAEFKGSIPPIEAARFDHTKKGVDTAVASMTETWKLLYPTCPADWLEVKSIFTKDEDGARFNHGIVGAVRYLTSLAEVGIGPAANPDVLPILRWAAVAMALHSLKFPGSKEGILIQYERDPLSFLLLLCDEIQVWNRERPDISQKSYFKACDLNMLECTDMAITAEVAYVRSRSGPFDKAELEFCEKITKKIETDNIQLAKYLSPQPLTVKIIFRVRGEADELGRIEL